MRNQEKTMRRGERLQWGRSMCTWLRQTGARPLRETDGTLATQFVFDTKHGGELAVMVHTAEQYLKASPQLYCQFRDAAGAAKLLGERNYGVGGKFSERMVSVPSGKVNLFIATDDLQEALHAGVEHVIWLLTGTDASGSLRPVVAGQELLIDVQACSACLSSRNACRCDVGAP